MKTIVNSSSLPPGPSGKWRPTFRLIRDPRGSMFDWVQRFGDPFLLNALNGPVIITGRPDLIRQVFNHDASDFGVFAEKALKPMLGGGSMLLLAGDAHRRERKLIMPMFHGDRMRAYGQIIQDSAIALMDKLPRGESFQALDVTTQISLQVIVQAIFGGDDAESIRELMRLSRTAIRQSSPMLFFSPKLHKRFFGLSPWDRFLRAKTALRFAFEQEIQRREKSPQAREDILSLLMQAEYEDGSAVDIDDACDELGTFLFAGHETSAIAMAWAIYHLHRNPSALHQLRSELQSLPDLSPAALVQLPYLKATVQETLRLHPIVTEVLRLLNKPMDLDRFRLPAGTAVAPATVLAHYRAETFPEPECFRPERFVEQSFSSAEYFPFGGGHRRCAGAAFASYEMAIVLGTLLSRYNFELLEPKPVVPQRRNLTMGPSTGIRVRLT